jgi:hypothetical protein
VRGQAPHQPALATGEFENGVGDPARGLDGHHVTDVGQPLEPGMRQGRGHGLTQFRRDHGAQPGTDDMIQNENSRLFLGPANGSKEGTAPIVQRVGPADPSTDDPTLDWDKAMCKS